MLYMCYNIIMETRNNIAIKVGDMVNYTGHPFDGPSTGGLILESRVDVKLDEARGKNVNSHQVYWATHGLTNWTMERNLELVT